jgi:hypothetical protein
MKARKVLVLLEQMKKQLILLSREFKAESVITPTQCRKIMNFKIPNNFLEK